MPQCKVPLAPNQPSINICVRELNHPGMHLTYGLGWEHIEYGLPWKWELKPVETLLEET